MNHHSIGSKERLGGAGGGGSGNGTGSFIRCNKCGGPLKSLDPKASCNCLMFIYLDCFQVGYLNLFIFI